MKVAVFDYELPESAIAQRPLAERDMARMLVVDPRAARFEHRGVRDWPSLVPDGALVVLNDTKVVKARLLGQKPSSAASGGGAGEVTSSPSGSGGPGGGKAELLLVEPILPLGDDPSTQRWRAIGKGLGRLTGKTLVFGDGALTARIEGPSQTEGLFDVTLSAGAISVETALAMHGHVPVPPYIRRSDDAGDVTRYQTVYARAPGAIAAPTAGLHLTDAMMNELRARGVRVAFLTLHVGLGTFQPVSVDDLDAHPMHSESIHVTAELAREIADARTRGGPVVAVGTTVVRALEAAADRDRLGHVAPTEGRTNLLIQPGYAFRVVDALLTNFHLPRSTLLALVAAFAGLDRTLAAYRTAVGEGYRFFSYGDAMWIPCRADVARTAVKSIGATSPDASRDDTSVSDRAITAKGARS